jgi:predicted permease
VRRIGARLRALWRGLRRGADLDAAMHEEMRFHLDMEAERLVREEGLDTAEARRRAAVAFGGVEKYKAQGRDVRGLRWLDMLSLDARLGVRMLVKYRGLTAAGGCAMAVAIALGATAFQAFREVLDPALPFEDGDRIVAIRYATPTPGSSERRVLPEFVRWREEIRSIADLAAFRTARHNLVAQGAPEPVRVAEMTASGFAVTRTPPLAGRYLVADDERAGAPPVVVIGYRAWQSRFGADPHVVGRTVTLGGATTTIVGVMPDGFRFPLDHQYWIPLRAAATQAPLEGPRIFVFGRLAPGATLDGVQAELSAMTRQAAADRPDTHAHLRLVALPYTHEHLEITDPLRLWLLRSAQIFVGALVVVVAINLAILLYARTVTRLGEIALRTALGASRRRILLQLFVEALALTAVGAAAGLAFARVALMRMQALAVINGGVPFWIDLGLSPSTVVYVVVMSVLAAAIMGVLPGLKATNGHSSAQLREIDGRTAGRLGPVWTTLVVAQVAVAVAILPMAVYLTWQVVRMGVAGADTAVGQMLIGVVALGGDAAALDAVGVANRQLDLASRLEAEPGVTAVAYSSGVPGFSPGRLLRFDAAAGGVKYRGIDLAVDALDVGPRLFDAYDASMLAGRALTRADTASPAVVVNRAFVDEFIEEGAPPDRALGVRFQYVPPYERAGASRGATYQVIGVSADFPRSPAAPGSDRAPTVYHAARAGDVHPFVLSVRFNGDLAPGVQDRFREIAAAVDPALQVRRVAPLADYYDQLRAFWHYLAWGVGLVTISVLLLSAAGMYAMMSFTVAQRTREIAIRSALGASPRRLLMGIFARAARQLACGLAAGSLLAWGVFTSADVDWRPAVILVLLVSTVMALVGLTAAAGPARRGLRVQPSDALRADG